MNFIIQVIGIRENWEGQHDENDEFVKSVRDPHKASEMGLNATDTRVIARKEEGHIVIVDIREFQSELLSLIYRRAGRGIDILPILPTVKTGAAFGWQNAKG